MPALSPNQKFGHSKFTKMINVSERVQASRVALGCDGLSSKLLREAAALELILGNRDSAVNMLESAVHLSDDLGDAWFCRAMVAISESCFENAKIFLQSAIISRFKNITERDYLLEHIKNINFCENRYSIFEVLYEHFTNEFCMFVTFEKIIPIERQGYSFCFARTLSCFAALPALDYLLSLELGTNGTSPWYWTTKGKTEWLYGDKEIGDMALRLARSMTIDWKLTPIHYDCGIMSWMRLDEAQTIRDYLITKDTTIPIDDYKFYEIQLQKPVDLVLIVGCDRQYFRFLPNFIFSVIRSKLLSHSASNIVIHCHIEKPEISQISFLQSIAVFLVKNSIDVNISISTSSSKFGEPAYYTCLRFLVFPEVLSRFQCGAIAFDVDSAILEGLFHELDFIKDHDFGFRAFTIPPDTRRAVGGEPWSIGAHPTFINYSEHGIEFARFIQRYVKIAYNPSHVTNWCIDQCAIGRAFDMLIRTNMELTYVNFAHLNGIYQLPEGADKEKFLQSSSVPSTISFFEQITNFVKSSR